MSKSLLLKTLLLKVIFASLCSGCTQISSDDVRETYSNSELRTVSPTATTTPPAQPTSLGQGANKSATTNRNTGLQEIAKKGKVQRVQFARGRTSIIFDDVVYQNYDNEYLLQAQAGQKMRVSLKVQKNPKSYFSDTDAAFDII